MVSCFFKAVTKITSNLVNLITNAVWFYTELYLNHQAKVIKKE